MTFQTGANNQSDQAVTVNLGGVRAGQLGGMARETGGAVDGSAIAGTGDVQINGTNIVATADFATDVGHVAVSNVQDDSAYAKAKAINASNAGVKAVANENQVTKAFGAAAANYTLSVNGVNIFQSGQASSVGDMVNQINLHSDETGVSAAVSGTSFVMTATDGRNINLDASTAQQGFALGAEQNLGSITISDDDNISIAAGNAIIGMSGTSITVDSDNLNTAVDLSTRSGSLESIDRLDSAIERVLELRGRMGAAQNRLEVTASNLSAISENVTAAKSRIRDADFASESALMTRNQILQQAASAMLSQANQAPNMALQLLR
jgi:flagellin